jgi:hypothetical protein
MGLKVKLAYWQMRPLTGVSEAYMVELSIQRVSQPGDVLHLLGVFSPENLSEWGYPVFNNVSWLVMPRVTLLGEVQVGGDVELARRLLSWHPSPQVTVPVVSREYVDDLGRHLWFEGGREGVFNSVEELVGSFLCCGHWPPREYALDVAGWLLRYRLEK